MATRFDDMQDDLPWESKIVQTAGTLRAVQAVRAEDGVMRGRFTNAAAMHQFLLAGKAIFTVVSKKTGTRFTFKCARPDENESRTFTGRDGVERQSTRPRPIWISVLSGPENNADYSFLGTVWPDAGQWTYKHSPKSRVGLDAPSVRAIHWMVKLLNVAPEQLLVAAEVWHEGRCGRCGRRLTVPESIESGFGPECAGRVA